MGCKNSSSAISIKDTAHSQKASSMKPRDEFLVASDSSLRTKLFGGAESVRQRGSSQNNINNNNSTNKE
jgi:hypothetical protein